MGQSLSDILETLKQKKNEKTAPRIVGIATNDVLVLGQADPGRAYYISTYQLQNIGEHCVEDFTADNALEVIKIFKETMSFSAFTDYLGSAAACVSDGKLDLACDNHDIKLKPQS